MRALSVTTETGKSFPIVMGRAFSDQRAALNLTAEIGNAVADHGHKQRIDPRCRNFDLVYCIHNGECPDWPGGNFREQSRIAQVPFSGRAAYDVCQS